MTVSVSNLRSWFVAYLLWIPGLLSILAMMQVGKADGVAENIDSVFGLPAVLCLFLTGFHRFYTGHWGTGMLWWLTGGLCGVGTLIDFFLILGHVRSFNQKVIDDRNQAILEGRLKILELARRRGTRGFSFNDAVLQLGYSPKSVRSKLESLMQEGCLDVFNDNQGEVRYREPCGHDQEILQSRLKILRLAKWRRRRGFSFNDAVLELEDSPENVRSELERLIQEGCLDVFNDDQGQVRYRGQ
ncbi:TM2 domain-containing protein [Candidatus Synechococcus spongiarum]|uniref:TM2 domain-containing protein n=1 Tax=Candidatus Synechococcus spongiarum TaxID=431041 RepID=UPI00191C26E9|nr:TM2 domain-containing protein [Candidatus Synechococcus spongiarum]